MSVAENKAAVRSWYAGINSPDWETKLHPLFTQEAAWEVWREQHQAFLNSFPDFHAKVEGIIGEGDHVAVWTTVTGTFSQPFNAGGMAGIEPQGQQLKWQEVMIIDFSGDEPDAWFILNELDRLRQLGVME
jgi:predicted ester cyclase